VDHFHRLIISCRSVWAGIKVDGVITNPFCVCSIGVYGLILPLQDESYCIDTAHSSTKLGIFLIYHMVLTTNSAGVESHANLPDILDIAADATSNLGISSFCIYHLASISPKNFLVGSACIVQPKAFLFIGLALAFHAQRINTLLGVYAANHQSLGRLQASVFTLDVHVLRA
jgi:hypothetical protein